LKPVGASGKITQIVIREQDPLKQGLKPCFDVLMSKCSTIREQDPLKQGLKLQSSRIIGCCFNDS